MPQERFNFFLNPYNDMAFTRCPKCDATTKQRKLPLVVHIEPRIICVLNKTCRFCPDCELVIARQPEIEPMLAAAFESERHTIEQGKYFVVGTLDRADWRAGQKQSLSAADAIERVRLFKDHLRFVVEGGWRPTNE